MVLLEYSVVVGVVTCGGSHWRLASALELLLALLRSRLPLARGVNGTCRLSSLCLSCSHSLEFRMPAGNYYATSSALALVIVVPYCSRRL